MINNYKLFNNDRVFANCWMKQCVRASITCAMTLSVLHTACTHMYTWTHKHDSLLSNQSICEINKLISAFFVVSLSHNDCFCAN